jgi:hypothetical protein
VAAYVAALRELAAKYEFPAAQLNERVRDQFAAWYCMDRIRERLLHEPAIKSLDELLTLAITMERAMAEAPAINEADRPVNRIGGAPASRKQPSWTSAYTDCGTSGHAARSFDCPAQSKPAMVADACGPMSLVAAIRSIVGAWPFAQPFRTPTPFQSSAAQRPGPIGWMSFRLPTVTLQQLRSLAAQLRSGLRCRFI